MLFFSSGLDSRTVSSAINNNGKSSTAMTVAFSENLEVKYARQAALCAGSEHQFLKLEQDHLEKTSYLMLKFVEAFMLLMMLFLQAFILKLKI